MLSPTIKPDPDQISRLVCFLASLTGISYLLGECCGGPMVLGVEDARSLRDCPSGPARLLGLSLENDRMCV